MYHKIAINGSAMTPFGPPLAPPPPMSTGIYDHNDTKDVFYEKSASNLALEMRDENEVKDDKIVSTTLWKSYLQLRFQVRRQD